MLGREAPSSLSQNFYTYFLGWGKRNNLSQSSRCKSQTLGSYIWYLPHLPSPSLCNSLHLYFSQPFSSSPAHICLVQAIARFCLDYCNGLTLKLACWLPLLPMSVSHPAAQVIASDRITPSVCRWDRSLPEPLDPAVPSQSQISLDVSVSLLSLATNSLWLIFTSSSSILDSSYSSRAPSGLSGASPY